MLLRRQRHGDAAKRLFCVSWCFCVLFLWPGDVMAASQLDDRVVVRWIQESLHEDPRVEASQMKVTFEKGVATLNGSVTTLAQREHATSIVRRVYGVTAVNNQLLIETRTPLHGAGLEPPGATALKMTGRTADRHAVCN